jgi:DegV family protein with EDD domain
MLQITTDSCADLSTELLTSTDVRSIPLHVLYNGLDHYDGDLELEDLFASVDSTGELPKTAAPSVKEFIDFFTTSDPVIYIGISSQLSATMQNAVLAAKQMNKDNLYLIDSLNLSTGIGLLTLKAVDLMNDGLDADQIVQHIESIRPKVRTSFVIDTMDYLYKGGRCTGLQAIVGSMLKIHPTIHVREDGTLGVLDKMRGNRQKSLDRLLAGFKADLPDIDLRRVFVTHSGCHEDAVYLAENLKNLADIEEIHITVAGGTISSHCGPNAIGILYIVK